MYSIRGWEVTLENQTNARIRETQNPLQDLPPRRICTYRYIRYVHNILNARRIIGKNFDHRAGGGDQGVGRPFFMQVRSGGGTVHNCNYFVVIRSG